MRESAAACLIFTPDGVATVAAVAASLGEQGICVTQCVERGECLDLLRLRHWPLLIIDANGATRNLLHLLAQCRRACSDVSVVVLVRQGDVETAVQAIKAGAVDCLETPIEIAPLLALVHTLRQQAHRESRDLHARLTPVEQTVLRHILDNCTNRQIADTLCRSPRTIEVHRRNIMQKLDAANLATLVRKALGAGLMDDDAGCRLQGAAGHPRYAQAFETS